MCDAQICDVQIYDTQTCEIQIYDVQVCDIQVYDINHAMFTYAMFGGCPPPVVLLGSNGVLRPPAPPVVLLRSNGDTVASCASPSQPDGMGRGGGPPVVLLRSNGDTVAVQHKARPGDADG